MILATVNVTKVMLTLKRTCKHMRLLSKNGQNVWFFLYNLTVYFQSGFTFEVCLTLVFTVMCYVNVGKCSFKDYSKSSISPPPNTLTKSMLELVPYTCNVPIPCIKIHYNLFYKPYGTLFIRNGFARE